MFGLVPSGSSVVEVLSSYSTSRTGNPSTTLFTGQRRGIVCARGIFIGCVAWKRLRNVLSPFYVPMQLFFAPAGMPQDQWWSAEFATSAMWWMDWRGCRKCKTERVRTGCLWRLLMMCRCQPVSLWVLRASVWDLVRDSKCSGIVGIVGKVGTSWNIVEPCITSISHPEPHVAVTRVVSRRSVWCWLGTRRISSTGAWCLFKRLEGWASAREWHERCHAYAQDAFLIFFLYFLIV